ncbi:hypothetical protein [Paenibacillus sp. FSL R5-0810]|uniref:hypothetical protein n=1 Tax=Paenibacillus sp. FSL R5-0810 TaxID=2921659 RepID=UPI0030FC109B
MSIFIFHRLEHDVQVVLMDYPNLSITCPASNNPISYLKAPGKYGTNRSFPGAFYAGGRVKKRNLNGR